MTYLPTTKTALDVANYVKRQFGDESGTQMTDADIWRWIDSAQLEIISQVQAVKAVSSAPTTSGVAQYDLSSLAIHQIESIHYNGSKLPSKTFSEAENTVVEGESGTPQFWYTWGSLLYLWPIPVEDGEIKVFYTKMPDHIEDQGTPLSVPDKYFESIVLWVMHKAYEMDEEFQQSQETLDRFRNRLLDQNEEEYLSRHATYQTITFVE